MAEGSQVGTSGRSYAIRTVMRPGGPVVAMTEINEQFLRLWTFAEAQPELVFLLTEVGAGLAGHRREELREMLASVIQEKGVPRNLRHADELYR